MGSRLGVLSLLLIAVPLALILAPIPEWLPQDNLTGYIVICGGAGASLLCAFGAGLIGSRYWFVALLGPAAVLALVLFSF